MGGWESSLSGRKKGEEWNGWILEKRKEILVRAVLDCILGSHSYSLRLKVELLWGLCFFEPNPLRVWSTWLAVLTGLQIHDPALVQAVYSYKAGFLNWGWWCLPEAIQQSVETFLMIKTGGCCWPDMMLNIVQCTGQSPTAQNYPSQDVNSPTGEKTWHEKMEEGAVVSLHLLFPNTNFFSF